MRKAGFAGVVSFLAVWAAQSAFGGVSLTYSNLFPPSHVHSKLAEAWCKEVEKRTNGEVTIQYFPGQTLTKGNQAYDGVVNGISDLALSLLAYTRGRFPVMEVVDMPLGYPSGKTATMVANEVYQELKPKELDDVKVMYLSGHGPGFVNSKTKPIRTMDDMKGLKFRATGLAAKIVEALGGTPVAMPMPETYPSLQKGVVDGALYPLEANKGWKLGEVTKYTTACYSMAYTSTFFVVMNKAKWNSISPASQKAIEEINQEWIQKTAEAWDEIDKVGREYILGLGNEIITLSPEESARWKKAVEPIMTDYVKGSAEKGFDGQQALDLTLKALEKYRTN
jgi:TRAP-type C4-dicarboxylate transport system substrate-binding protein